MNLNSVSVHIICLLYLLLCHMVPIIYNAICQVMITALWKKKTGKEDREGKGVVLRVYREGFSDEVTFKQGFKGRGHTDT